MFMIIHVFEYVVDLGFVLPMQPPDEENPASELNAFRLKFDVYMTDVGWPSLLDRYEEGAVNSGLSRVRAA